jgi:fumarate hydratase class II
MHSITILTDGCTNFRRFLIEGTQPHRQKIAEYVQRSLMLVTALVPVIGYDKASQIAHYAMEHDLTLKGSRLTAWALSPRRSLTGWLIQPKWFSPMWRNQPIRANIVKQGKFVLL